MPRTKMLARFHGTLLHARLADKLLAAEMDEVGRGSNGVDETQPPIVALAMLDDIEAIVLAGELADRFVGLLLNGYRVGDDQRDLVPTPQ